MKGKLCLLLLAGAAFFGASAYAAEDGAGDGISYYMTGSDAVVVCYGASAGAKGADAAVITAVYDGDELIRAEIHSELPESETIQLLGAPENASVKLFTWDAEQRAADTVKTARRAASETFAAGASEEDMSRLNIADGAEMYVNGVYAGGVTDNNVDTYICLSGAGCATFADVDGDGAYERADVEYYKTAVVEAAAVLPTEARLYLLRSDASGSMMRFCGDTDAVFVKDGREIDCSEIGEGDILTIRYDAVGCGSRLDGSGFYHIRVSSDSFDGTFDAADEEAGTITVDGQVYSFGPLLWTEDLEVGTSYTFYTDVFGDVQLRYEIDGVQNYGIITAIYDDRNHENPIAEMITADGSAAAFECADGDTAERMIRDAASVYGGDPLSSSGEYVTKEQSSEKLKNGEGFVCEYRFAGDRIEYADGFSCGGGSEMKFNARARKIGAYQLDDEITRVLNLEEYIEGVSDRGYSMQVSDFADKCEYKVWTVDKNDRGAYRLAVVLGGAYRLNPTDPIAVVSAVCGSETVNGAECVKIKALCNGEERELYVEDGAEFKEGTVFVYRERHKGYVEDGYRCVIMTPGGDYDADSAAVLERTRFSEGLGGTLEAERDGRIVSEIAYDGTPSKSRECRLYLGPVYTKNNGYVGVLTGQTDGVSDVYSDFAGFKIAEDALFYIYDYTAEDGAGVSVGEPREILPTAFEGALSGETGIDLFAISPDYALVKVVDGMVEEYVGFLSPSFEPSPAPTDDEGSCGVIVGLAEGTVTVAADNGDIVTYNVSDELAAKIGAMLGGGKTYTKDDISAIGYENAVIRCSAEGADLISAEKLMPNGGVELRFDMNAGRFGEYLIDASTKMLDFTLYERMGMTYPITIPMFEDEGEYSVYMYDRNADGVYRFAIFLPYRGGPKPEAEIAVIQEVSGTTDIDGTTCTFLRVSKGGQGDIEVVLENEYNNDELEGAVIAYVIGSDGYVEDGDLYVLFTPAISYESMISNTLSVDDFMQASMVNRNCIRAAKTSGNKDVYEIVYDGKASGTKDVYVYYGPVYKKQNNSLELFTSQTDGTSAVTDTKYFNVGGVDSYVYDFGEKSKYRVYVGSQSQSDSVFKRAYADADENLVSWSMARSHDVDAQPEMAFVKEVDGDVTEVVYYVAP